MPTEMESRVLLLLSAIEIEPKASEVIESWGNEAVTIVCEAALGTYVGLRPKIRWNAIALLGGMNHPQARETLPMLVNDADRDVAIYAMRAAGQQRNAEAIDQLGRMLREPAAEPLRVAESFKALREIGTDAARTYVDAYLAADPGQLPHRRSVTVTAVLRRAENQH